MPIGLARDRARLYSPAMSSARFDLVFIGFGEAAMAFAADLNVRRAAFDCKINVAASRAAKIADCAALGVVCAEHAAEAVGSTELILSLVTASEALAAARSAAAAITPGALYCDMNSVGPDTKRAAAWVIESAGGRYVDVAVMAPVHPGGRTVPLLVAGPHATAGLHALAAAGFTAARLQPGALGAASAVKMVRSVLVKGLEALTTECVLAAAEAGVLAEVVDSLNASWPGVDWAAKAEYNLERMMVHGIRRAEEMEEVVRTLDALGTGSAMARATAARQRAVGALGLEAAQPLAGKIAAVLGRERERAV